MEIRGYTKGQYRFIEKQHYYNVGTQPFQLISYRDPAMFLQRGLIIYTNEAGTQALKYGDKFDYIAGSIDLLYSTDDFVGEQVWSSIQIINPLYQNTDLWISWYWVADYVSDEMLNRFDRGLDQMINSILTTIDGNVVINNSGNVVAQGEEYPGFRQEL